MDLPVPPRVLFRFSQMLAAIGLQHLRGLSLSRHPAASFPVSNLDTNDLSPAAAPPLSRGENFSREGGRAVLRRAAQTF
mgnify:CR=1 FL=1